MLIVGVGATAVDGDGDHRCLIDRHDSRHHWAFIGVANRRYRCRAITSSAYRRRYRRQIEFVDEMVIIVNCASYRYL